MVVWNAESDAKLLVAVLRTIKTTPNLNDVAVEMAKLGISTTPNALTHRIGKLKAMANASAGPASAPATPRKRAISSKANGSAKKRKREMSSDDEVADQGDSADEFVSKVKDRSLSMSAGRPSRKSVVKKEYLEESDEDPGKEVEAAIAAQLGSEVKDEV